MIFLLWKSFKTKGALWVGNGSIILRTLTIIMECVYNIIRSSAEFPKAWYYIIYITILFHGLDNITFEENKWNLFIHKHFVDHME